jgi:trimethylamine--corrinoid protein Co-methyltransferase
MNPHTTKRMKSEALLTRLSDREAREIWEKKGSLDTHARAMQQVNAIMAHAGLDLIPPEVDARIRDQFKGLVSGKLEKTTDGQV